MRECEAWFGKPITIMQSRYKSVAQAWKASGLRRPETPQGAPCTKWLKKRVRKEWEQDHSDLYPLRYVWGMDAGEAHRADRIRETMIEFDHSFPLIERGIGKEEAHEILRASGIRRPAMYDLGFHNNNCMGCVKGGMGYFNHLRRVLPEVFAARATLEREIGVSILKDENGPIYLDELDPERGRHEGPIVDEYGILFGVQALSMANARIEADNAR